MSRWEAVDDWHPSEPGSYAISTVDIIGAKSDGTPVASINSAVCDICGAWATDLAVSGSIKTTNGNEFFDRRECRRTRVIIYTCPDHHDAAMSELVDEFGGASNVYDRDELAEKVDRTARRRWKEHHS